jgi:hypothetical protein
MASTSYVYLDLPYTAFLLLNWYQYGPQNECYNEVPVYLTPTVQDMLPLQISPSLSIVMSS